jgi:dehydrogenase/reductase SDR family member 1
MTLAGRVALVTGATRQVGRGVAIALSQLGAKVYITSRRMKEEPAPPEGQPRPFWGSLERTIREGQAVGAATLVPIACDHRIDEQTHAVFEQIAAEDGRLDILVNSAWGGYERLRGSHPEEGPFDWNGSFWEQPLSLWDEMQLVGVRSNYIVSALASRMMTAQRSGLIVSISFHCGQVYMQNVAYGVSHAAIDRMAQDMAVELKPFGVASVSLYPMGMVEDVQWNVPGAESGTFIGRAVAALYTDPALMDKTGRIYGTRALAKIYGFTDANGSQPEISEEFRGWVQPDGTMVCPNDG